MSKAAGRQDNLYCSMSSGCKHTVMKQDRANRKRFQSSMQKLRASKEKTMTRRGKRGGQRIGNEFTFSIASIQKDKVTD